MGQVRQVIVAHKDRLPRYGFDWFVEFCAQPETELVVMNQETQSAEREMVNDLLSIVHMSSARYMPYGLIEMSWSMLLAKRFRLTSHSKTPRHCSLCKPSAQPTQSGRRSGGSAIQRRPCNCNPVASWTPNSMRFTASISTKTSSGWPKLCENFSAA